MKRKELKGRLTKALTKLEARESPATFNSGVFCTLPTDGLGVVYSPGAPDETWVLDGLVFVDLPGGASGNGPSEIDTAVFFYYGNGTPLDGAIKAAASASDVGTTKMNLQIHDSTLSVPILNGGSSNINGGPA